MFSRSSTIADSGDNSVPVPVCPPSRAGSEPIPARAEGAREFREFGCGCPVLESAFAECTVEASFERFLTCGQCRQLTCVGITHALLAILAQTRPQALQSVLGPTRDQAQ